MTNYLLFPVGAVAFVIWCLGTREMLQAHRSRVDQPKEDLQAMRRHYRRAFSYLGTFALIIAATLVAGAILTNSG